MNKDNLNVVKLTIIGALGEVAKNNSIEFTKEQDRYMGELVNSLLVRPSVIPEGMKLNDYIISKIKEILSFLDKLWERHERLQDLED